ncbi:MAG: helix-turn-helix domain-containing protein [Pseudomonadota bacterium]|nr:helix-turn-helix domain-containing protein [Pseudomonadota bacterium]
MSPNNHVGVRFYPPPEDLRRYFTTFYLADFDPGAAEYVSDALQPEWAGLRFFQDRGPRAWVDGGTPLDNPKFFASGPSSRPIHFNMPRTRMWGIGLLPLGWARFVRQSASDWANVICDGAAEPKLASFMPLAETLFDGRDDEAAELGRIMAFFRTIDAPAPVDEKRIVAVHAALVDEGLTTVSELVERVAASQRTVERICDRHFGFSPKLLLRRQRFMRSLAQFMLDPTLKWIGAMDSHYHDQAQFVRDFREFMGVSPREYAATPHPILAPIMQERNRVFGQAAQTLDRPDRDDPRAA